MQHTTRRERTAHVSPYVPVATDAIAQRDRRALVTAVVVAVEQPRAVARRRSPVPCAHARTTARSRNLFRVLLAGELVHRRVLHDLLAGDLPGFLDDPRQRAVLTGRLVLDL